MVVDPYTVVDPRAVVVIAFYAAFADRAMLAAGRHEHFAVGAKFTCVHFLKEVYKFMFRLKVTGVAQGGNSKTKDKDRTQNKEGD